MKGGLLVEPDEELTMDQILAKMTADSDQAIAGTAAMGVVLGTFYKSLRRNGCPRRLATDIVSNFASSMIGASTLEGILEQYGDDDS
jgi:hypothetical protein